MVHRYSSDSGVPGSGVTYKFSNNTNATVKIGKLEEIISERTLSIAEAEAETAPKL